VKRAEASKSGQGHIMRQIGPISLGILMFKAAGRSGQRQDSGGAGGIRTLDRALQPYNGLANRRLQPLGHSSVRADMPDAGASRKRQIRRRRVRQPFCDSWRRRSGRLFAAIGRKCASTDQGSPARCADIGSFPENGFEFDPRKIWTFVIRPLTPPYSMADDQNPRLLAASSPLKAA
jgi:hypothetical protein